MMKQYFVPMLSDGIDVALSSPYEGLHLGQQKNFAAVGDLRRPSDADSNWPPIHCSTLAGVLIRAPIFRGSVGSTISCLIFF